MSRLILLNGPLNCGKTYAVDHLKKFYPLVDRRCKDKLFNLVMELFSVPPDRFWTVYETRELKEQPLPDFQITLEAYKWLCDHTHSLRAFKCYEGMVDITVREAMIYVSEVLAKPTFGRDYFGSARMRDIGLGELAVDDSAGFPDELVPAIERLGQDNLLLVRIKGRGSFEGDSRDYIPDGVVNNTVDVYNTGSLEEFLSEMNYHVNKFLEE